MKYTICFGLPSLVETQAQVDGHSQVQGPPLNRTLIGAGEYTCGR